MSLEFTGLRLRAVLFTCLVLTGCPGPGPTLEIVEPEDGARLNATTDTNNSLEGVQTRVVVRAEGLAEGNDVDLTIDGAIVATLATPADGVLIFEDVTVSSGTHTLRASARAMDVQSEPISITVESIECFAIGFVTPRVSGDRVTFGPADDTDGEACGTTFETTFVVSTAAPDGSEARIVVNGIPQQTATVAGGAARFEGVAVDRRLPMENTVAVEITSTTGVRCAHDLPVPVYVDCAGVSCSITSPDASSGFLNIDDDVSDAPGFQGNFEVTTDEEGAGQPVRLILDGNETGALIALPDGTVASFGNVPLSEGVHRVQAECSDGAGNTTRSAAVEWTVDITPCAVTVERPSPGSVFVEADDLDTSTPGVDIEVAGTRGADCDGLRVGLCSAIDGQPFTAADTSWTSRVELGSAATQDLCVDARDLAGNVNRVAVGVRLVTASPRLEIAAPAVGSRFNTAGDDGFLPDLDPSTEACDARFEVYCTGVGADVEILREGSSTPLATAPCVADATVPAPYVGIAVFDGAGAVPLPSVETGASFNVVARQTVDRLTGTSPPVSLRADCAAPQLVIVRPTCGATLLASNDEDPSTPDLEYSTNVLFGNGRPGDEVTLTIGDGYVATRAFATSPVIFSNARYASGGVLPIEAEAVDWAGNVGRSAACSVTVADIPSVAITAPGRGAVLGADADCAPETEGMQIRVRGTTDAPEGSTVRVDVGATESTTSTVGAGGAIDVCADAVEGRAVRITVAVTDARGTGSATVTVVVDTVAPATPISDVTASVVDRRRGAVRFAWTAVDDHGLTLTNYQLRCGTSPIASEADWDALSASAVVLTTVPGAAGTLQSEDVRGFRPGETLHCMLRGADPTGALTPLPSGSVEVFVPFLSHEVASEGTAGLGGALAATGDVNGDGIDDVLIGGDNAAYLYFGSSTGLGTSPNVEITGGSGWALGTVVAGLGDFNGDGIADFAISARGFATNKGAVFVFYGRPSSMPWPATITIDGATCAGADVCFVSDDGAEAGPDELALLGFGLSAAGDFDGDGLMDVAIGAPGANDRAGRLYVLLGSSTDYPSGTLAEVPGAPGTEPRGFVLEGDNVVWRQLGNIVSTLGGDLNGDGRHDLVVQSAGRNASGTSPAIPARADYVPGRAHSGAGLDVIVLTESALIGSGPANTYGLPVSGAGDVNGDGLLDVGICDRTAGGSVVYHLGALGGFAGASTFRVTNDAPGASMDEFGGSMGLARHPWLGVIGDIDGDRIADAILGADELGTTLSGHAHLFYFGAPATNRARSTGIAFPVGTGTSELLRVAFVGDVNGDGFADIALGDRLFGSGAGRVVIQY